MNWLFHLDWQWWQSNRAKNCSLRTKMKKTHKPPSCLNSLKRRKRACRARWCLTIDRSLWVLICETKRKPLVSKRTELFCTNSTCLEEHATRKGKALWTTAWSTCKKTRILFFLSKVMLVLQEIEFKGLKYLGLTKSYSEDSKLRKTCKRSCDLLKTHPICSLKCFLWLSWQTRKSGFKLHMDPSPPPEDCGLRYWQRVLTEKVQQATLYFTWVEAYLL